MPSSYHRRFAIEWQMRNLHEDIRRRAQVSTYQFGLLMSEDGSASAMLGQAGHLRPSQGFKPASRPAHDARHQVPLRDIAAGHDRRTAFELVA
jgi:hypothetical protein